MANGGIIGPTNKPVTEKISTFTSSGNFTTQPATAKVDYLVVAGGGGGGHDNGGGGGAGGFRLSNSTSMPGPETSPLASATGLSVTGATTYAITGGGGGAGGTSAPGGCNGRNSVFSTITSAGGGGGGSQG